MENVTKNCKKCGQEKPLSEYYVHKKSIGSRMSKCKDCVRYEVRSRAISLSESQEWLDKERARHREKYHRLGYKEKHKPTAENKAAIMRRYWHKCPEKRKAHSFLSKRMKPISKGNELHHWSYDRQHWLDVIELSVRDHNIAHRFLTYDNSVMMYRRKDNGELLDSREKHECYIMQCIENSEQQCLTVVAAGEN